MIYDFCITKKVFSGHWAITACIFLYLFYSVKVTTNNMVSKETHTTVGNSISTRWRCSHLLTLFISLSLILGTLS
uniref:Uncharacterized protein n=1 Tax=Pararge aegeria TaxID=116150 RepID=S4P4X5_9NEOP